MLILSYIYLSTVRYGHRVDIIISLEDKTMIVEQYFNNSLSVYDFIYRRNNIPFNSGDKVVMSIIL